MANDKQHPMNTDMNDVDSNEQEYLTEAEVRKILETPERPLPAKKKSE